MTYKIIELLQLNLNNLKCFEKYEIEIIGNWLLTVKIIYVMEIQ